MSRAIDYVTLTVIIFMLTLIWSTFIFSRWALAIIFAVALSLLTTFSVHYFFSAHKKPYGYERLALEFSVRGATYLTNIIKSTIKNTDIESGDNYILLDDCILVAAFKFSQLSINDLNSILQLAVANKRNRVFIMARGVERRAYQLLQVHEIKVSIVKIQSIFRFLQKNNALPVLKPQRRKFSFALLLDALLGRTNTKNYVFSGAILIAMSFLTPLKIYYLIFGSISLLMALLTLTPLGKGTFRTEKFFDKLTESNQNLKDNFPKQ